ncbi:MAG: sigma 54-interacting transcriptional regulator [Peptostreptococcaceae bacterium]|nr:sigma 54-interacting transcriptional regulator [Peptostreptococcaceae bacterium]
MKLRSYKRLFLEMLEHINEGVHVIDADGKTIYYNARMAELEQLTGQDVIDKPFDKVFENIHDSTMLRSLETREIIKDEMQSYINRYGRQVTTVNTTIPIVEDREVIAVMEIAQNITRIQEMSETILELQNANVSKEQKAKTIKHYTFSSLIGRSAALMKSINIAEKASQNDASVFIFGETGTGKEMIAQSIHYDGIRKHKPFIAQNCAAIPEALLEGILFGTVKGGFTGAVDRIGVFEQANGGTLLLDEINSMPYETQAKILRALQEGYIRRVGGTKDIPIDVRIIAISNESADELLQKGTFRKDLYYRLNVININVAPLRERKEDIIPLAENFIKKYNQKMSKNVWMISDKAKEMLLEYGYPGNVRELENIIARGLSMVDDEHVLLPEMLAMPNLSESSAHHYDEVDLQEIGLDDYLQKIEKELIEKKMQKNRDNITQAARELGIKRQTLQHKLKKYNLRESADF